MIKLNLKKINTQKPKFLNIFKLGRSYAPFPLFYLVHLTLNCNAKCYYCYQREGNFQANEDSWKKFFSVEAYEKLLKEARGFIFKKPLIHFFGGEPLLHPRFSEILDLTKKHKYQCSLTTNGILLKKYLSEISSAENLTQINISMPGTGDIHTQIIGSNGAYEQILESIKHLSQLPSKNKKIININCVMLKENLDYLDTVIIELSSKLPKGAIDVLVFQYPLQEELHSKINSSEFQKKLQEIKSTKTSFEVHFTSKQWVNYTHTKDDRFINGTCNIPWLGLGILPNGDVMPGGSILACSKILGNLNEKSLKEIWNGQELRNFRKIILSNGLPSLCYGCCLAQLNK